MHPFTTYRVLKTGTGIEKRLLGTYYLYSTLLYLENRDFSGISSSLLIKHIQKQFLID